MQLPRIPPIGEIEVFVAQVIALVLLTFGGVRLVIHELTALKAAVRELQRSGERRRHEPPPKVPSDSSP